MHAAGKVRPAHGESDTHKLFEKWWLSLKVPISTMDIRIENNETISIPHYKACVQKDL